MEITIESIATFLFSPFSLCFKQGQIRTLPKRKTKNNEKGRKRERKRVSRQQWSQQARHRKGFVSVVTLALYIKWHLLHASGKHLINYLVVLVFFVRSFVRCWYFVNVYIFQCFSPYHYQVLCCILGVPNERNDPTCSLFLLSDVISQISVK